MRLLRSAEARKLAFVDRTRSRFFRIAGLYTPALMAERDGERYLVSTTDPFIGHDTFVFGPWDAREQEEAVVELQRRLGDALRLKGGTVLDVGANIGTQSIPFIRRFGAGRVVAIEADPANATLLRQNVIGNGLEERVTILNMAAAAADGTVELQLSPTNPGDHRVTSRGAATRDAQGARETVSIPATRLDKLVEEGVFSVDEVALVWIDVQGHEGDVLSGAQLLLAAKTPVVCEYWPFGLEQADGLALFHELVSAHFSTVVDLQSPWPDRAPRALDATEIAGLAARYPGSDDSRFTATDLVLVPDPPGADKRP